MASNKLVFRVHAIRRMFQRRIGVEEVRHILTAGEVIENYPDDLPFPSRLVLGWSGTRPLHVVAADNPMAQETSSLLFTSQTLPNGNRILRGESYDMHDLQASGNADRKGNSDFGTR